MGGCGLEGDNEKAIKGLIPESLLWSMKNLMGCNGLKSSDF